MKKLFTLAIAFSLSLIACGPSGSGNAPAPDIESSSSEDSKVVVPVDYSKGRAMNKRLGKGINLGNAWDASAYCGTVNYDSQTKTSDTTFYTVNGTEYPVYMSSSDAKYFGNLPRKRYNDGCKDRMDSAWSNPISNSYFKFLKDAGFNSVRIPVRWQHNSDPVTHKVNPDRLAGVKEDIQLAIDAGLAVIVSFHWYYELNFFADNYTKFPELYQAEKEHFAAIWTEVATTFKDFPDTMLVWDIMNEPTMSRSEQLNEVITLGYNAIRAVDSNKTIMFESYQSAKFGAINALDLPLDGNIIYSGHYYQPYEYTHQGHNDMYPCKGDAAFSTTALADMTTYVKKIKALYPDVNGSFVPLNMGEFGVSGGPSDRCKGKGPSEKNKAFWAEKAIEAAEAFGMSWHYWGFTYVGGFEAYNAAAGEWYQGFPGAFGLKKE